MSDLPDQGRRAFLRHSLTLFPVVSLGTSVPLLAASDSAPDYKPTFFSPPEWSFLQAAVARLIPADQLGPGALEAGVPEYIDRQMQTPYAAGEQWYMQGPFDDQAPASMGYQLRLNLQQLVRQGIGQSDALAQSRHGRAFASLKTQEQEALLREIESGKVDFEGVPASAFFSALLQLTREGFFCDPVHGGNRGMVGWKLVGFPGARADFMDWIERGERYAYPPVSLDGRRG